MNYWCLVVFVDYIYIYTAEKGSQRMSEITGQDSISSHVKWLGLCVKLVGAY
jgi:hypothetical protein